MITFEPMENYMKTHKITKYQLIKKGLLNPSDVTRLGINHNYTLKFIDKLCREFGCQPGDLIAYVPDQKNGNISKPFSKQ